MQRRQIGDQTNCGVNMTELLDVLTRAYGASLVELPPHLTMLVEGCWQRFPSGGHLPLARVTQRCGCKER